jgi:hypothetical protein
VYVCIHTYCTVMYIHKLYLHMTHVCTKLYILYVHPPYLHFISLLSCYIHTVCMYLFIMYVCRYTIFMHTTVHTVWYVCIIVFVFSFHLNPISNTYTCMSCQSYHQHKTVPNSSQAGGVWRAGPSHSPQCSSSGDHKKSM